MAKQTKGSLREYWRDVIQRQQVSGLSIERFCRRESLATATFFAMLLDGIDLKSVRRMPRYRRKPVSTNNSEKQ